MHVGLNLVYLVPGETGGMETYARELLPRLAGRPGVRLTAFVNQEAADVDWGPGIERVVLPVRARNRVEWVRGEQWHLPRAAQARGCDLVHSLASTAPLWGRFRRITTIHDLHYKLVPDAHFGLRAVGMRVLVPSAGRRSHRVIAVSEATRHDIVNHLRLDPSHVDVVLSAASPPTVAPTPEPELRERLNLGDRPVVLSVSAKRPHKNLPRLIRAVAALDPRPVLVLPGYPTPHEDELRALALTFAAENDVVFPPWLSAEDLEGLYALARCFAFPSLYEGFGLPVLEAMQRGLPVATSMRASLAEVAGDAALVVDPDDVASIRDAIERLLHDDALHARLVRAGLQRAAAFSWDRTADETYAAYRRALA